MASPTRTPRKALHERSNSQTNTLAAVRLVPYTPPRLSGERNSERDEVYSRTALPTSSVHVFPPQEQGYLQVALKSPEKNVSSQPFAAKSQTFLGSGASTPQQPNSPTQSRPVSAASSKSKPLLKKRKHVAVDPRTKTFKVLDVAQHHHEEAKDHNNRLRSPTSLTSQSSHEHLSLDDCDIGDLADSSASCVPESTIATSTSSTPISKAAISEHNITTAVTTDSPWNYQLVGGLRKVPKTPDLKQKAAEPLDTTPPPPIPKAPDFTALDHDLSSKPSFQSQSTISTTSDNTNYKVYGDSSPSSNYPVIPPPSSHSNLPPTSSPSQSSAEDATILSEENYELHGDPSPSNSPVALTRVKPAYSQESLIVAPLQPRAREPKEKLGYYKQRSRESLRTGSLTSISTVLSQREASQAIVTAGSIINLPALAKTSIIWGGSGALNATRNLMQAHPHQWSSQLSTVPSESEGGSARGSRSWSDARRSSGVVSPVSRQLPSVGSSFQVSRSDSLPRSFTGTDSLERPHPAFIRQGQRDNSASTIRMVEDQDEYGDGLGGLPPQLRERPSRQHLSGFFSISSSDNGRTNTMKSTTSSRANSLLSSSIPTWAKLYYGSGERKYLGAPSSSTEGSDSRPHSVWSRSGSPDTANFPLSIYSPRRRPREIQTNSGNRGSMEITPAPIRHGSLMHHQHQWTRRLRERTSSIWSPHLRTDRRAVRQSVWEPPSMTWSTESGGFGRRNRQMILFVLGFIFPMSWMIAACLPLPPNPTLNMREINHSEEELSAEELSRTFGPAEEKHYQNAKWWRWLNRWMSLVGLLIIAAIIVLAIIGVRQRWGS